jgi:single-strand DNA-binding protein
MATNERRKGADGEWTETTEWHRVVTFGKTAENCNQYLKKGRQAFVEGRLRTNKWQDKEGNDRYTTEIIAQTVQFIGGGRSDGIEVERTQSKQSSGRSEQPPIGETVSFDDDDIPF